MFKRYAYYMAINNFSSSALNIISTNSMLNSIITKPSFSEVVTFTYIGKDIIGQLGGLIYAMKTGNKADKDTKKYLYKGVIFQQASFYLENLSPFITNNNITLPFLGITSTLKNLCFISLGAVNARNLQKLSSKNIGESYSRLACINTLSSTGGMLFGLFLIYIIPSYTLRSFLVLPFLSSISIYSMKKAIECCD